jgi:hypothetical protein
MANWFILLIVTCLTVAGVFCQRELKEIYYFGEDETNKRLWIITTILIYAIFVSILSAFVPSFASTIVENENLATDTEQEESQTKNQVLMASIVAYTGLFMVAYIDKSFAEINFLMVFMYVFQKIITELYRYYSPRSYLPGTFASHASKFKPHFRKFPDDYEEFSSRQLHIEAEQQTLMRDMPTTRVAGYNDLLSEFGWINLFAPVFPAAAFIAVLTNLVKLATEKDIIAKFNKRGTPMGAVDIGGMLDFFEFLAVVGTINSVGIVLFTSVHLQDFGELFGEYTDEQLIVGVFIVENLLIAFRFFVAAIIPDYPEWI